MANQTEALIQGIISSTDSPEVCIRRNRDGQVSVRIYAGNRRKTGHGPDVRTALNAAANNRGKNPT